ncbi:family 16 glycosylhydrolase [Flavobacterium sp. NG2]|uniref:family 16 glycosylhydrolase n=1 Tax=Flavobacterium sp. NG2 TaxID=3097547 RepID=UPI002A83ACC1|nr:family 16 glycosylhydrolase [Flavobacterium sp. NG2]WPR71367.1 family 16 glycosylhydrolase [Flavobacterium sp. NG2]
MNIEVMDRDLNKRGVFFKVVFGIVMLTLVNCSKSKEDAQVIDVIKDPVVVDPVPNPNAPLSDQKNTGEWVLNEEMSDEFDGAVLDETKWHIQGKGGVYQSNFIGRAPSQFSTNNVRVEKGMLKLETRWEPTFNFSTKLDNGVKYENITTAAIISKKEFTYGYLEVKSKAADCEITSSFWATGSNVEFDFFEMFGDHKQPSKEAAGKERELWWSIHDWTSAGAGRTTYTESHDLGFRVAAAFHVYGFEWSADGVKIYIDGKLFRDVSRATINAYDDVAKQNGGNGANENFVITKPLKIWFDQETFPWHGVPDSKEEVGGNGTIDFEIEYLRIWQKKK